MKVKNYHEIRAEPVVEVPGMTVRWLISELEEHPRFAMRLYELEPGAATTPHVHHWEHQVLVLSGQGAAIGEAGECPLGEGDVVYVPPLERHYFINTSDEVLSLLMAFPIPRGDMSAHAETADIEDTRREEGK